MARLLFQKWCDLPGSLDEVLLNRDLAVHLDRAGYPTSNRPGVGRPGGEATLAVGAVTAFRPCALPRRHSHAGHLVDGRVSIWRGAVFPTTDGTGRGEERAMDSTTYVSEPASELECLITDLSGAGPLVFVFGDGFTAAHLKGVTAPLFRGPDGRRWWHVELGGELDDGRASR